MLLMFANICVKRNIRQDTVLVAVSKNQKNSSLNKGKVCFSVVHSLGVSSSELTQQFESVRDLNSYLAAVSSQHTTFSFGRRWLPQSSPSCPHFIQQEGGAKKVEGMLLPCKDTSSKLLCQFSQSMATPGSKGV